MKISVLAKPNAKTDRFEAVDETHFSIAVKAPAHDGLANEAIIAILATHFSIPKHQVRLCSGKQSKHKRFELPDTVISPNKTYTEAKNKANRLK
jgi:uncharacterized protein (TIGR00251 family)